MSSNNNTIDPVHYLISSRGQILEIAKSQLWEYLESDSFDPWIFDTSSKEEAEKEAEKNRASVEACEKI